jgi:hypothetical protein
MPDSFSLLTRFDVLLTLLERGVCIFDKFQKLFSLL